jgi:hypothetical protein
MYFIEYDTDLDSKSTARTLFMFGLFNYILAFGIGFSSTVWAVNSEFFPIHLMGTAMSLASETIFLSNFIVASVFLSSMESDKDKKYIYGILVGFALFASIFVYFFVPETAGRKIEDYFHEIINGKFLSMEDL